MGTIQCPDEWINIVCSFNGVLFGPKWIEYWYMLKHGLILKTHKVKKIGHKTPDGIEFHFWIPHYEIPRINKSIGT